MTSLHVELETERRVGHTQVSLRRTRRARRRSWVVRRALAVADALALLSAFAVSQIAAGDAAGADKVSATLEIAVFLVTLPGWLLLVSMYGLYDRDEEEPDYSTVDDLPGILTVVSIGIGAVTMLMLTTHLADPYPPKLLAFWFAAILLLFLSRSCARTLVRSSSLYRQNAIIVGGGKTAKLIGSKIMRHPGYGIDLLGVVDTHTGARDDHGEGRLLGGLDDLEQLVETLEVDRVIVAAPGHDKQGLMALLRTLRSRDVQIDLVPRFVDLVGPGARIHTIEGVSIIGLPSTRQPVTSAAVKRAVDLFGSVLGLLLVAPILVAAAVAVKVDSRGPVLYRHERLGRHRRPIRVYKLRTMKSQYCRGPRFGGEVAEEAFAAIMSDPKRRQQFERAFKLDDDPRLTRIGAFLRRTSLDELPQLLNVLRGDLSLVGPRPITAEEVDRYGAAGGDLLLNTRPGITGYWQVNGRSDLDYADRVRLDLAYVEGWSIGLDLTILAKTVKTVLRHAGAR